MQAQLYALSPANIVRLSYPRERADADKYDDARRTLEEWLAVGTWTPEDRPAIYSYHQTYRMSGRDVTRAGVVALGEVTEYACGEVLPHERTHSGPKRDRLRLLEATDADTGMLLMLVSDLGGVLQRASAPAGEPIAVATDLRGEQHRLWRVVDEAAIAELQGLLARTPAIIADGHHRYETAVEYARRHSPARWKMMAFFGLEAPGVTILANHRLVRGVPWFDVDRFLERARYAFDSEPLAEPHAFQPTNATLALVTRDRAVRLHLRTAAAIDWPPETSPAWRSLAVSVLHEGLLRPLLGITDAALEAGAHVDYTAQGEDAIALARAGDRYQAAFLIAATTPDELKAVVHGGEVLPQKSTHFYPKLLDGLLFHRLV